MEDLGRGAWGVQTPLGSHVWRPGSGLQLSAARLECLLTLGDLGSQQRERRAAAPRAGSGRPTSPQVLLLKTARGGVGPVMKEMGEV